MRFETFWQAASWAVPGFATCDVTASLYLYCKMVKPAIRTGFPGAEVQATWIRGNADPQVEVVATWGPANQAVEDLIAFGKRVEAISQTVWKEGDWILPFGWDEPGGYPVPDRSKQTRTLEPSADDAEVDLGWNVGTLSDGRPYRVECWQAIPRPKMWTLFMSTRAIEHYTEEEFKPLLVRERLLEFTGERRHVQAIKITDDAGQEMWSVNVVVSDERTTFVVEKLAMRPYTAAEAGTGLSTL